jgi:hypothetical protein
LTFYFFAYTVNVTLTISCLSDFASLTLKVVVPRFVPGASSPRKNYRHGFSHTNKFQGKKMNYENKIKKE